MIQTREIRKGRAPVEKENRELKRELSALREELEITRRQAKEAEEAHSAELTRLKKDHQRSTAENAILKQEVGSLRASRHQAKVDEYAAKNQQLSEAKAEITKTLLAEIEQKMKVMWAEGASVSTHIRSPNRSDAVHSGRF